MDALAELLGRLEAGELGDPLPVLSYVAGRQVDLPEDELQQALRRALLLLAAGGDPNRPLEVDGRAVKALALDVYSDDRRRALGAELDELVPRVRDLPTVRRAVLFLAADVDLAWRLFALGLIADELGRTEVE